MCYLCFTVSGRRAGLTIEEVQVVTFYNRASILEQVEFNKVEELLTKTKKMLDMKDDSLRKAQAENLVAFKNSKLGLEDAIVQRIYGDLLVLAKDMSARYPNARSPETSVGALDKYTRSVMLIEETATIEDMQREAIIVSLREKSYTCLARHSLQMLAKYKANELDGAAGKDLVSVTARCQQVLFDRAGVFAASNVAPEMLAHIVIESMIKGLSLQSSFCMERVLVLFNLITEHTQHVSGQVTFGRSRSGYLEQLLQIPAWCYLRFSAQLMGSLDLSCGDVVYPIVLHIAKTYPHALHYSFRITCEVNSSISLNKAKYSQLHSLLANKSIDDFVEALLACSHPELRFSDAVKSIDSLLAKNTNTNLTSAVKQQVLNLLDEVYTFCLSQSWPRIGHKIGKYNRHFAKALLPKVNSIVGSKRESIFNKDVLGKLKELRDATQNSMKHTSGRVSVAEFSEWLGDFDSTTLHILIPEQYTIVHATPREPEVINTIAGELLVMESIRKPKRLSLVSNTGVGYRFLVKGGEDLRNDERIEQLFGLMNQIVRKHERYSVEQDIVFNQALDFSQPVPRYLLPEPATRPTLQADTGVKALEALRARTYGVVPMSTKVGILEWVPNTISLRAILAEEMVKDDYIQKTQRQAIEEKDGHLELSLFALSSAELRTNWLKGNGTTDYHQMYRNAPLASAAAVYDAITSILPTYYLQRRLLSMSRNAETYYTLLHEFLASLSVNNIFGYILGIGDRHLENLLLDSSTGSIVNIDFGICFGMGASVLPVPELIPMRLTRQLTDIAQPLQGLEVIRQHMQRVLGCLRKEKSLLQNALEIYINDPLMDWMRGAAEALDREALLDQREQLLGGSFESSGTLPPNNKEMSESVLWEPVRRVGGALRKLSGEDPLALLQEDLSNNVMVTRMKSYDGLCRILGDVRRLLGAEAGGTNAGRTGKMKAAVELTVEEQVDALMAMATDPNVLVRQWVGLQAWL
ncbi:hypothetical protein EON64_00075 [archaeon]|nr:MAG: hypothetical protein EON64_00075 [archaeon]